MLSQNYIVGVLLGFFLLLSGCVDSTDKIKSPQPPPLMTAHNKLNYSSNARSFMSAHGTRLKKRFAESHGHLSEEHYQVPSNSSFDNIVDYYAAELAKTGEWAKVDQSNVEWQMSSEIKAVGWSNKEKIFIVYSLSPSSESDVVPVYTLTNLKEP